MEAARDPYAMMMKDDFFVPLPRVTDALGQSLRRLALPIGTPEQLAMLIDRLDTLR